MSSDKNVYTLLYSVTFISNFILFSFFLTFEPKTSSKILQTKAPKNLAWQIAIEPRIVHKWLRISGILEFTELMKHEDIFVTNLLYFNKSKFTEVRVVARENLRLPTIEFTFVNNFFKGKIAVEFEENQKEKTTYFNVHISLIANNWLLQYLLWFDTQKMQQATDIIADFLKQEIDFQNNERLKFA